MNFTLLKNARPATSARARSLRRGLLLSASAGWALSYGALSASAQTVPATPAQNGAARKSLRMAQSQEAAGSVGLAAACFREAVVQAPNDVAVARELARFYTRQNRADEARASWLRVAQLKRGDAESARELERLRLSSSSSEDAGNTGVSNASPLPPTGNGAPSRRASALKTPLVSKLPPVAPLAPEVDDLLLAQVPMSDLPSLPEAPAPSPPAPGDNADFNGATSSAPASPAGGATSSVPGDGSSSDSVDAGADANAGAPDPAADTSTSALDVPDTSSDGNTLTPSPGNDFVFAPPSVNLGAAKSGSSIVPSVPVSPVTFAPPRRRIVRTSKVQAARAWPFVNRGAAALKQKRTKDALSQYRRAVQVDEANPYAWPGVAVSQLILGNFDAAAQGYLKFLAIKPSDPATLRSLADALTYGRRYREALGVNNYILTHLDSRSFEAAFQNGQIYTYLRSYDNADRALNLALSINRNSPGAWNALGESRSYRHDPRARQAFETALSLAPGNARVQLGLGNFFLYSQQFKRAIPLLRAAVNAKPTNVGALVSLGDALSYSGRKGAAAEAVGFYSRALNQDASNIPARVGLGRALVYSKRAGEGINQLQQVLDVQPNNVNALEVLALAQVGSNPTAASATFGRLLGLQRDPAALARTYASLGDAQLGQTSTPLNARIEAATQSYAQAVRLAPSDPHINLVLAQLLSYGSHWTQVAEQSRRVLQLVPGNAQAQALLLQAAIKTGDQATATRLGEQLANAAPRSAKESLALAQALRDAGNPAGASRLLVRAATQTSDPQTSLQLADTTRDVGNYPDAVLLYTRLLQLQPGNAAARLGLAKTFWYSGNLSGASTEVRRFLAQSPGNSEAQLLLAQIQMRVGTREALNEAATTANAILTANPNPTTKEGRRTNSQARVILGRALETRQRFTEAVQQLQGAVALDPNNASTRARLARTLNYARDYEGAITEYRNVINLAPTTTLARLELAQILLDRARYTEAEVLFNEVLRLRRGTALLPAARRAIADNSLQYLTPDLDDDSPLVNVRSVARVAPRTRFAQNTTPSGPTLPAGQGSLGTNASGAGTAGVDAGNLGSGTESGDATTPAPDTSGSSPATGTGATTSPSNDTTDDTGGGTSFLEAPSTAGTETGAGTATISRATPISDQGAALIGLGESRRRQNRFVEAADFFRQALSLRLRSVPRQAALVGLAQSLRGQRQFAEAGQQVQQALQLDPANIPARVLRAQLLGDAGQKDEATAQLNTIVSSLTPIAPLESYTQIALALNSVGNYPASLDLLSRAVARFPTEPGIARLQAETLGFAGQNDAAINAYNALLTTDPNDFDAQLGKARVYNYANSLTEAETAYRKIVAAQPTNFAAVSELADVLGRSDNSNNYNEAITLYGQAVALNPLDLPTRIRLARLQRSNNRPEAAEATLNQILNADADPNNIEALIERGSLRGSQGNYSAGIADLQQAEGLAPNDPRVQLGLAQVQGYAGNYTDSIASYQKFLASNPPVIQARQARVELGEVLSYAGRSPEGVRELDAVLVQDPNNLNALLARATILARSNRPAEAITQYNAILASNPPAKQALQARTGLADAFLYGRRYNEAIGVYNQLLKDDPSNTTLIVARARALSYSGRSREAVAALRTIVANDQTNIPARLALAEAGANSGSAVLQRDAIGDYRQILKTQPDNLNAQLGLARVLSYRGQYGESKAILNRILATQPKNNDARLALAETQRFAGNPFDAKKNLELVAQSNPGAAQAGLAAVNKATSPSVGVSATYYHDSNGVNLRSFGENAYLRTRLLTIGVLADQGKFRQGQRAERNRTNLGVLLARQLGPFQAQLIVSRLKYTGVNAKTLYDASLGRDFSPRSRFNLSFARRDIFETDLAVARGITADTVNAFYSIPLGSRLDFETRATYYNYSDNNSRVTVSPSLFFRFRPTNPSLRVGLGYTNDNTRQTRDLPFVYYTPQNFNAASILADYIVTQGSTRYGISGSVPLTSSTGRGGLNRPADTLFAFLERDLGQNFDVFVNGGIVRVPNGAYHSEQISGGLNLRF